MYTNGSTNTKKQWVQEVNQGLENLRKEIDFHLSCASEFRDWDEVKKAKDLIDQLLSGLVSMSVV